eukprot:3099916-Rhodomonas_salina.1
MGKPIEGPMDEKYFVVRVSFRSLNLLCAELPGLYEPSFYLLWLRCPVLGSACDDGAPTRMWASCCQYRGGSPAFLRTAYAVSRTLFHAVPGTD